MGDVNHLIPGHSCRHTSAWCIDDEVSHRERATRVSILAGINGSSDNKVARYPHFFNAVTYNNFMVWIAKHYTSRISVK